MSRPRAHHGLMITFACTLLLPTARANNRCPGDITADGTTGQPDLGILLANWGS